MSVTLADVKTALNITGDYQDATLSVYIEEVTDFLVSAGVAPEKITTGLVVEGVATLWNYGGTKKELSQYFIQRAAQLSI